MDDRQCYKTDVVHGQRQHAVGHNDEHPEKVKPASPPSSVAQASPPASAFALEETLVRAGGDACATEDDNTLVSGWHSRGYLPHLKSENGTYFVTFRLADTLPKTVLERYRAEREDIVLRAKTLGRDLTRDEERQLAMLYSERIDAYLDAGHGKCWLRKPELGGLMADTLQHFDGVRYILYAWVVMPNHVHVVVTPLPGHELSRILHSWKSFTAHEVKKMGHIPDTLVSKSKAFWQRESHDHLVRDDDDLSRVIEYTIKNPVNAGLCAAIEDWPYVGFLKNTGESFHHD
ncbi:MAG: transposase [Candidatus Hydrogenedentes bacterium]|nr:transposase [Candidatus Hydrogenedentota bacterium]